jgi:hypothetical protein
MSQNRDVFSFLSVRAKLLAAKNKSIGPIAKALRVHKYIKWLTIVLASLVLVQMLLIGIDFRRCNRCRRTIDKSLIVIGGLLILPSLGFLAINAYTLRNFTKETETEIDLSDTSETQFRHALLDAHNDIEQFNLEPGDIP